MLEPPSSIRKIEWIGSWRRLREPSVARLALGHNILPRKANDDEIETVSEEAVALWKGADFDSDGLLSPSEWQSASYSLSTIFADVLKSIFDVNADGGLDRTASPFGDAFRSRALLCAQPDRRQWTSRKRRRISSTGAGKLPALL